MEFLKKYGLLLAWLVSLIATICCIIRVEVMGTEICPFCWYQRIFLFPQVILLGIAVFRKDYNIIPYSMTLATLGALVSVIFFIKLAFFANTGKCLLGALCQHHLGSSGPSILVPILGFVFSALIFGFLWIARKR